MYSALLGLEHGIFELLQGLLPREELLIQAVGAPCQPDKIWHACLPALSLLPNLQLAGMITVVISILLLYWAVFRIGHRLSFGVMIGLSVALLLSGGGFVPVWIGLSAGLAVQFDRRHPGWIGLMPDNLLVFGSWLWIPLVAVVLAWLPLSWLMGTLFPEPMLRLGTALFLLFDIFLPIAITLSGSFRQVELANREDA